MGQIGPNDFLLDNVGRENRPSSTQRYELITQKMDWSSAARHCHSKKAGLVGIYDKSDQLAITRYLSKISSTSAYICLYLTVQRAAMGVRARGLGLQFP